MGDFITPLILLTLRGVITPEKYLCGKNVSTWRKRGSQPQINGFLKGMRLKELLPRGNFSQRIAPKMV